MNNKGEITVGAVIIAAIGIITALVMLTGAAPSIGQMTSTASVVNQTINLTSVANTTLNGYDVSNMVVLNGTTRVSSGNYTIDVKQVVNGEVRDLITGTSAINDGINNSNVNISYTYKPSTYIDEAGGRTVAGLVILFAALAIAIFAMVPVLRNGVIDLIGG